ncbi:unnamed protein product [Amoebophrya sp. A120]|nr:unnamed protein product [Amoebophrya sp. A120]|eukprot:GSA120T00005850001.1
MTSSRQKHQRAEHSGKHGGKESGKGAVVGIVFAVALAAGLYMFRGPVGSFVLPKFVLTKTTSAKKPDGEFALLGWANWLEKVGTSADVVRCCYAVNFKEMHDSWCSTNSSLSMMDDGIKILSQCSENLRGRTEYPIESFHADKYEGKVRHSTRGSGAVFLISEFKRRASRLKTAKPSDAISPMAGSPVCKILEGCANDKTKGEKPCREVRKLLGDCFA